MLKSDICEIAAIFSTPDTMQLAIAELETAGFERRHISVLGDEETIKERFGIKDIPVEILEDHPKTPRAANVKIEELAIGQGVIVGGTTLTGIVAGLVVTGGIITVPATTIATAFIVGGAGGATIGGIFAKLLGEKYNTFFKKQMENGGLLVWVNTPDAIKEQKAKEIFQKYGGHNIHKHTINQEYNLENEEADMYLIEENVSNLEKIIDHYQDIIEKDSMLSNKLEQIHLMLQTLCMEPSPVSEYDLSRILKEIKDSELYAKSMAEEEQHIMDECGDVAAGEEEIARYFSLAKDLNKFAIQHEKAVHA